jgi:hypothetical protein
VNEEQPTKKKPGRRPGEHKLYPHQHGARFTASGWERLGQLAERWECSEAEVIRRAVDAAAEREGIKAE